MKALATVASIGHVKLIKEEDAGDAVVPDNALHIPDFRVVLEDARQLLVEVKNTHPKDPLAPIRIKTAYLDGLIAYAGLTGGELLVATYWSKWNLWTLVAPHAFGTDGQYQVVSMPEAMMHNRMADLGDVQIATRPPLRLRLTADIQKVRSIDASGQVEFTISAADLFSGDQPINNPLDKRIAMFLMFYGDWCLEGPLADASGNQLNAIEFHMIPEHPSGQEFDMIGSLSSMFSNRCRMATHGKGQVEQVKIDYTPGFLGRLIPRGYSGTDLPLWKFVQEAAHAPATQA